VMALKQKPTNEMDIEKVTMSDENKNQARLQAKHIIYTAGR
jgi:hypothetical protein